MDPYIKEYQRYEYAERCSAVSGEWISKTFYTLRNLTLFAWLDWGWAVGAQLLWSFRSPQNRAKIVRTVYSILMRSFRCLRRWTSHCERMSYHVSNHEPFILQAIESWRICRSFLHFVLRHCNLSFGNDGVWFTSCSFCCADAIPLLYHNKALPWLQRINLEDCNHMHHHVHPTCFLYWGLVSVLQEGLVILRKRKVNKVEILR